MAKQEKAKATEVATQKVITVSQALDTNYLLDQCSNKGLQSTTVVNIIKVKGAIKKIIESFNKEKDEVMAHYNVTANEEGVYDWAENPEKEAIQEAVSNLLKADNEIKELKSLSGEEFSKLSEGLNFQFVSFLGDLLMKED